MTLGSMGPRIDWDDDSLRSEGPIDIAGIPTTMRLMDHRSSDSPFCRVPETDRAFDDRAIKGSYKGL